MYKKIKNLLNRVLSEPYLIIKAIHSVRKYGVKYAIKKVLTPYTPNFHREFQWIDLREQNNIFILTTRHCYFIASLIQQQLDSLSFSSEVIFETPKSGFGTGIHFVICPQFFNDLPENYIAFQLEQSVTSRWFDDEYLHKLKNAYATLDYSVSNIAFLQQKGLSFQQLFFMPLGFHSDFQYHFKQAEIYDVLFYGDIKNERRKKYIEQLSSKYNVKVLKNCFGDQLYQEIAKTKIIVNIHYYDNALLETTRLYECLSLNKLIISEKSEDLYLHKQLEKTVDFVDIGDISQMCERIDFWLNNENQRKQKIEGNLHYLRNAENLFEFYFLRFMLANDWISFDEFYHKVAHHIKLNNDFICLGLPETPNRAILFNQQNHYNIQPFSGLRHSKGWIGCGMSYKFLLKLAKEQGLAQLTICEDDVLFYSDSYTRYINAKLFLQNKTNWHIFSGLIADLNENTEISNIENEDGQEYIYLNKMTSMVMNIYHQSFYDKLVNWDEKNQNVEENAIDRYIEKQGELKVVTTLPYLVSHCEDADSTLWGINNSVYSEMIKGSERKLAEKVNYYKFQNES